MADILSQEEIDNLLNFDDDIVESHYTKSFKDSLVSNFKSLLSLSYLSIYFTSLNLDKESAIDSSLAICEIIVSEQGKLTLALPTYLATALIDLANGGDGEYSDSISDEGLKTLRGIISTILDDFTQKHTELDFEITKIFFKADNTTYSLSNYSLLNIFTLRKDNNEYKFLFIADEDVVEIFEITKPSEDVILDEEFLTTLKQKLPKENISHTKSIISYESVESISNKADFTSVHSIEEFENENLIINDEFKVTVYDTNSQLLKEIPCSKYLGLSQNTLYLINGNEMSVYDENLQMIDSYMIWMIDKFKDPIFFNDKIITSQNTIERDGILAGEDKFIDSDIHIWNRGKIEKTLKSHLFGASCYQLGNYLITYGIDGNNIWDSELNLVGKNKDIQSFKMIDDNFAIVENTIFDFNLLLNSNNDDKYIESSNFNADMGDIIDDRVITYGFKTIYLWDKFSPNPIKTYDFEEQIKNFTQLDSYLLVNTLEEKNENRIYYLLDSSLNKLLKFELPDCNRTTLLEDSNKIILYNSGNSWMDNFTGEYYILDINERKIIKKEYEKKVYFHSVGLEKFLVTYILKDKLFVECFNKEGELLSKDYYQNNLFLHYQYDLGIHYHKDDSKDIFWYESSNHNGVGNIVMSSIEKNILKVQLLQYDHTKLRVTNDYDGTVPNLKDLKIKDTQYIFSNGEIEFIFNDEGIYEGENILQLYKDIEDAQLYKIANKKISDNYGRIISKNERSLLHYEGCVIIEQTQDYLIINDHGKIKYLGTPQRENYSKKVKSLKSKIAIIYENGSSGSIVKLVPSHRMDLLENMG